jgi:hypothetical protein
MPKLFAKIELKGAPDEAISSRITAEMESLGWSRCIVGSNGMSVALPPTIYQRVVEKIENFPTLAEDLKFHLESNVWIGITVLVIEAKGWGIACPS